MACTAPAPAQRDFRHTVAPAPAPCRYSLAQPGRSLADNHSLGDPPMAAAALPAFSRTRLSQLALAALLLAGAI
ncbi:hypothetical protein, partial [Ideonella azotifigens]|uniref:hypothetical protein n=1 Tax=Ideonella azotifigens TaxID=513160 RepID=UPI001B872745